MKSLKTLIEEIEKNTEIANTDMTNWPLRTRPAMETRKATAALDLVGLRKQYASALHSATIGLFAYGQRESVSKFLEIASEEGKTINLDASELYRRIAQPVEASLGRGRLFSPTEMAIALRALRDVAVDLEIVSLPGMRYVDDIALKDFDAVVNFIRRKVREVVGDDLNRLYLSKRLLEQALSMRYTAKTVPVVIYGLTSDEQEGLSSLIAGRTVAVEVPETVDRDFVINTFREASGKKPKSKTKQESNPETQDESE